MVVRALALLFGAVARCRLGPAGASKFAVQQFSPLYFLPAALRAVGVELRLPDSVLEVGWA